MFAKIIHSPFLNLVSGLILLVTASYETFEKFDDYSIGVHHGILVFSFIQILKSLPEILHGLKSVEESVKHNIKNT